MSANAIVKSVRSRPTTWISLANRSNRCTVYIGRAWNDYPTSQWANPFKMQRDTPQERKRVLTEYANWLRNQTELLTLIRLGALKGAVLGCWCAPKLCHGMLLAKLSDSTAEQFSNWVTRSKSEPIAESEEITPPADSTRVATVESNPKVSGTDGSTTGTDDPKAASKTTSRGRGTGKRSSGGGRKSSASPAPATTAPNQS